MTNLAHPQIRAVGMIVPPANPAIEPEMRILLPDELRYYVNRFEVNPSEELAERNRFYLENYPRAVDGFGVLPLSATFIGLTGASYHLRHAGDRQLCTQLSEGVGRAVATASLCVAEAFRALSVKRIAVISPYPSWLTGHAVDYWTSADIEVGQTLEISPDRFTAYEMSDEDVVRAAQPVDQSDCDLVFISGTGAMSVGALRTLNETARVPVVSSNICGAWWLSQKAGCAFSPTLTQACPPLAAVSLPA